MGLTRTETGQGLYKDRVMFDHRHWGGTRTETGQGLYKDWVVFDLKQWVLPELKQVRQGL